MRTIDDLTFKDDYMFGAVLRDNPDICKQVLEAVLGREIDHIHYIETQRSMVVSSASGLEETRQAVSGNGQSGVNAVGRDLSALLKYIQTSEAGENEMTNAND